MRTYKVFDDASTVEALTYENLRYPETMKAPKTAGGNPNLIQYKGVLLGTLQFREHAKEASQLLVGRMAEVRRDFYITSWKAQELVLSVAPTFIAAMMPYLAAKNCPSDVIILLERAHVARDIVKRINKSWPWNVKDAQALCAHVERLFLGETSMEGVKKSVIAQFYALDVCGLTNGAIVPYSELCDLTPALLVASALPRTDESRQAYLAINTRAVPHNRERYEHRDIVLPYDDSVKEFVYLILLKRMPKHLADLVFSELLENQPCSYELAESNWESIVFSPYIRELYTRRINPEWARVVQDFIDSALRLMFIGVRKPHGIKTDLRYVCWQLQKHQRKLCIREVPAFLSALVSMIWYEIKNMSFCEYSQVMGREITMAHIFRPPAVIHGTSESKSLRLATEEVMMLGMEYPYDILGQVVKWMCLVDRTHPICYEETTKLSSVVMKALVAQPVYTPFKRLTNGVVTRVCVKTGPRETVRMTSGWTDFQTRTPYSALSQDWMQLPDGSLLWTMNQCTPFAWVTVINIETGDTRSAMVQDRAQSLNVGLLGQSIRLAPDIPRRDEQEWKTLLNDTTVTTLCYGDDWVEMRESDVITIDSQKYIDMFIQMYKEALVRDEL